LEEALDILERVNGRSDTKTVIRDRWRTVCGAVDSVEWPLNGNETVATVPREVKAAVTRPSNDAPTAHDEAMPVVAIDGDPELAETLRQREKLLEVLDAAVWIVMLHGKCSWLSLLGTQATPDVSSAGTAGAGVSVVTG
jgi:hypothetical protein